ncbi:TipJ family phage tail tip protein [Providencia sp. PROV133]|uniref:TipJ family phage tail tip protein n=1 Tax=Providencia sp. PROV133 TaxID=2949843 RepID=UPI003FA7CA98
METIYGAKGGGGGGHTPVESKDSLLSESTAKILLAISEGEIAGGLDDTRIFLDDTPIGNADGSKNFEGVTWEFRAGSEHQEYIQGIPSVDNEIAVGMELKDDQPYVRSINNTQLSAVRIRFSAPQFMQQHDNGDTTGYRVDYIIELSTDGSGYKEVIKSAFDGKTTSEYQRTHRIELPKANTGWQLRVRRLTKNQNTARIADKVTIAAVVEVIDAKLRYPNTALLFITFNARQFNNRIPKISVRPKGGLLIKVPTNYDPINRTYSGVWDGTFKLAATNNPAWVFYDLVLNNRYGCGDRINASQIDKWDLYKIAQYCDEMVPDGRGGDGKEPRFLCDVYIQSQETAYTVLRDIAAIFRGMTYWSDNKINVVADMPEPVFRVFTNANIVGGKPTYSGGSIQNRYTQALVSFTDIDNHSNDDVEAVADLKLQHRYGVRKTELSAIGCTRRSEANRRGRWALLTNANDRMVTFATGLEGAIPSPGHIIGLADSTLAGRSTGGRISSVDGRKITLDRTTSIKVGDRLIVNLPDGKSEGRTVTSVNQKVVTVSVEYSQVPQKEAVWVVDSDDLAIQLYRVINISDNGDNTYTISGAIHNPDNYDHIDAGARIDERPITVIPPKVQPAPKNVRISSYTQVDQGIAFTTLRVDWEAAESAIAYEAEWRRDNGNWINAPRTSTLGFEVNGIYAGRYQVRVRAINASEISSVWANADETQLNGKEGNPPKPLNLRATSEVWGITLNWGFDANTSDTLKTELQYSSENTVESMQLLADVPYPLKSYRMSGLKAGVRFYFRARLVDKSGNQSEWTSAVLGESSTDVDGILEVVGDKFLTNEAGKQMQEQIDFSKEAIAELELDTIDVKQKVVSIDRDVEAVNEAVMMNTQFTTEVHFSLKEEVADRKAEIFRIEQVQVTDREAAARWQEKISAEVSYNAAEILNIKDTQTSYEKATAQQISQVKADVDGVKSRVTTVETATADLKQSQAKFEQSTTAEFGEMRGYITHFETSLSNVELAVSEAIMQTTAQVNQHSSELLQSKADVKRIANATATNEKATAELAESMKAHYEDSQAEFVDVRKSIAEQDKAHSERTEQVRAELGKDINSNKEELSKVSAAVTTNTKAIAKTDETVTELQQLQTSQFNDNSSSIANVQHTQANADSTHAESTLQLAVQQNQQGTEILRAKASIRETNKIVADNDKAYAQKFTQLDSQFEQVNARFTRVESTLADAQQSITETKEQLYSEINSVDKKVTAVDQKVDQTKATLEGAIAESNHTLSAKVEAAQDTANTAKSNAADAKQDIDRYKNSNDQRMLLAETQITANKQAIANEQETRGSQINKINSELGGLNAAFEAQAKTYVDQKGNASSIFGIKNAVVVNGQYYEAQMILGAEVKNGQVVTQIGFSADTFGIFNPVSGKLEPVFFVENGQVFINEAFINQATIEKLLIGSTIKSKNWDPLAKKGLMLDFENGKLIANDAEITGKIYATDGEFNGTVYVEKLIGDNAVAATYKYATKEEIHGSKYDQVIESKIIYTGGMPYDVDLLMPTMQFESAGSYSDAIIDAYVQIIIDGVTHTPQTTKVINGSSWKLVCSFYATIPASKKDVVVTVRYTTYHAGKCTTKILPAMVIACKHNSSSFKIS